MGFQVEREKAIVINYDYRFHNNDDATNKVLRKFTKLFVLFLLKVEEIFTVLTNFCNIAIVICTYLFTIYPICLRLAYPVKMEYRTMLRLQICLYLNSCLCCVWIPVIGFFLYVKINILGHLSKYLSISVYTLLCTIEGIRLYLGNYGNLSSRVPELAGFLMLSVLMQMPLVSFFLLNPYLYSTPTEIILHTLLALLTALEIVFGFSSLKHASSVAKSIYLSHSLKVNK